MAATTQELEDEVAKMEDRLANVKVVVEVEREAWRRSSRTGKRGTKWKGAAQPRNTDKEVSANNLPDDEDFTVMPVYWDALELAQYLQTKQLTNYAQVVVYEQITGKILLDTPATKLRKLFEEAVTTANDPGWKAFQNEFAKLQRQQRRLEKAIASGRLQPYSARSIDSSIDSSDQQPAPSAVMSAAGAALVFPLISPRMPGMSTQAQQQKPQTASRPPFPMRKPASSNNLPMATCWNCKTRFFRPHPKRPAGGNASVASGQPVSSSMRASLLARAYCSQACQDSIESSDIRISPSLSARVKVTFNSLTAAAAEKPKRPRPSRVATGLASVPSFESHPSGLTDSEGITANRLEGSSSPQKGASKHIRKSNTFARRSSKPDASLDTFDFLHVAAPRREVAALESPPRQDPNESYVPGATAYISRGSSRPPDVSGSFSITPTITSISSFRADGTSVDLMNRSPNAKTLPPALVVSTAGPQGAPSQCKTYQQSKYRLDPDLFQAHQETFSSCFGCVPLNNRVYRAPQGSRVDPGRGNLLRLQGFLTVRALHRLSLTCRAWYELITLPSAVSDALWGIHVLRIWRPSEEDDDFLLDVGVLKKPERPRRMLQILTRQVARVVVDSMKVLLGAESWQLATVMSTTEGDAVQSLNRTIARARSIGEQKPESRPRPLPAELYELITVIYTRAGEIVAVCARQLIRPVDPMALLTDILQGLKSGELLRVHCRRLRLFSQTNRLPFDQWAMLPACSRTVVEFFWSSGAAGMDAEPPPSRLPVWHQKVLTKLQQALQQRLLGKDSIQLVIKLAHDQNVPPNALLALEKFLTRCHTHGGGSNPMPRAVESSLTE